jgi:hypothetical protein
MTYLLSFAVAAAAAGTAVGIRHHRKRQTIYRTLAEERAERCRRHRPTIQTRTDPRTLREAFERDRLIRVEGFLAPESLAALRREFEASRERVERSYIPGHKKGGTLSYEAIHRYAPACLALYHAPEVQRWLGEVVGAPLKPTADHDQSSCSLLCYDRPGDHIQWHYDHNFYKGRHFTILLSLVNRGVEGGLSAGRLQRRAGDEILEVDTSENVLVMFEGARVFHRATAVEEGDERVMLSMTLCTDPGLGLFNELARRVNDTAYYGPRVLLD